MHVWRFLAAVTVLFCLAARLGAAPVREVLPLNSGWQMTIADTAALPGPDAVWKPATVPSVVRADAAGGSVYLYFRQRLTLAPAWSGKRVFLHLLGARYHPRVFVEGRLVAEQLDGWTPFRAELTAAVAGKQECEVTVCCQDWGAVFADGFQLPADAGGDLRRSPLLRGKLLAPIGGHYDMCGIWDDVELLALPPTHLTDVAVVTSVRQRQLTVSGRLDGTQQGGSVDAEVLDGSDTVLRMPAAAVTDEGTWQLRASADGLRYWSPEDPHLYTLQLTYRAAATAPPADVVQLRFGYRELWAEGRDFVLNGTKRHLLASSGWPIPEGQSREAVEAAVARIKAGNNVAFRLHTQPWQRKWLEVADELGLMIVEEGAMWCDSAGTYAYKDPRFWRHVRDHLAGMVRRDRNHPSLVMWSIENELLHCGAGRYDPEAERKLGEAGRFVRQLDPAHLITFEADLDPDGAADVIGLHYPHEMPDHADYPNTANWLGQVVRTGTGGELLGSRGKSFRWRRDKPLYIGEFLWVPYRDYSPGTVFFGDQAYLHRERYNRLAKAEAWKYQIQAYRRAGVSGMCPWTFAGRGGECAPDDVLYLTQKAGYRPLAAFPKEMDSRFFSGEAVSRSFDVFNDTGSAVTLALEFALAGKTVRSDALELPPAGIREVSLRVQLPNVEVPTPLTGTWCLVADGKTVDQGEAHLSVHPRRTLKAPKGIELLVYAPNAPPALAAVPGRRLLSLADLPPGAAARLLIIGPDAFTPPAPAEDIPVVGAGSADMASLRAFVAAGGRVLVLEQRTLAGTPFGVSLVEHASTMTFPVTPRSPLFDGLSPADFRFWRGDHYVSRRELRRPGHAGGRTWLVSGGREELAQGALAELCFGAGRVLLCQALVGRKLGTEPAAAQLLANAVDYLARPAAPQRATLLLTDDEHFGEKLRALGVDFRILAGAADVRDEPPGALLVLHGGKGAAARWRPVVEDLLRQGQGKLHVYWQAPDPEAFMQLRDLLGVERLELTPCRGPISLQDDDHELLAGISREEFVYVGSTAGRGWQRGFVPDPHIIDACVLPARRDTVPQARLEAEDMALSGSIVERQAAKGVVLFATVGQATGAVDVPEVGVYRVVVRAGGSPCAGVYPAVVLSADGKALAQVSLTGDAIRDYATMVRLPAGQVSLSAAFVNDRSEGKEDRNLLLDALIVELKPVALRGVEMLTLPPALAAVRASEQASTAASLVVIDSIRWDRAQRNRERAQRYASALLANLGATFRVPEPQATWLTPSTFSPVGEIPFYRQDEREIGLVAAGTVQGAFRCAQQGVYEAIVRGRSTSAEGVYARVRITVDGTSAGETELVGGGPGEFPVGRVVLSPGEHRLAVIYTNDLWQPPEDRNLYLQGVGFRRLGSDPGERR